MKTYLLIVSLTFLNIVETHFKIPNGPINPKYK